MGPENYGVKIAPFDRARILARSNFSVKREPKQSKWVQILAHIINLFRNDEWGLNYGVKIARSDRARVLAQVDLSVKRDPKQRK
jgi:peroxiredoxin